MKEKKNKTKKIKGCMILILLIGSIFSCCTVYADPNSSKGFAEYDDVKAGEESQKMIEEQEKEQEEMAGKSTNNYLESLEVEGYEISPQFDKQTLEYVIEGDVKAEEITIEATPSDERAKVKGTGKIKLIEGQSQYRIEVIAESGTVRTYLIKIQNLGKVEENEKVPDTMEETNVIPEKENKDNKEEIINISILIIFIIIIAIYFLWKKLRKIVKKRKH